MSFYNCTKLYHIYRLGKSVSAQLYTPRWSQRRIQGVVQSPSFAVSGPPTYEKFWNYHCVSWYSTRLECETLSVRSFTGQTKDLHFRISPPNYAVIAIGVRAKMLGVRIMYPCRVTCLPVDCYLLNYLNVRKCDTIAMRQISN